MNKQQYFKGPGGNYKVVRVLTYNKYGPCYGLLDIDKSNLAKVSRHYPRLVTYGHLESFKVASRDECVKQALILSQFSEKVRSF